MSKSEMEQSFHQTSVAGKVRDLRDAQADSVGTDPYMRGLYNGLELALTMMENRDPVYIEGPTKTDALHSVLAERQRQIMSEGWTLEHDDAHWRGEMALAAACYASNAAAWAQHGNAKLREDYARLSSPGFRWPWAPEWWKPKDQRRDLVRAAALLLAEIERIDRAATGEA